MKVDYNEIAKKYDLNRTSNPDTIARLISGANITKDSVVVDFGCGTGNFTHLLKDLTGAVLSGVEPSDAMREKAIEKDNNITFLKGDHKYIPIENDLVDFIYMTDVIHHVPDITQMFKEFKRILKVNGKVCIVTESYRQLESRFWVKHFPTIVDVEKNRYPDIETILECAELSGLAKINIDTTDKFKQHMISDDFIRMVENKGCSMFYLISDEDYTAGLKSLKQDYDNKVIMSYTHGETFLWLQKDIKF